MDFLRNILFVLSLLFLSVPAVAGSIGSGFHSLTGKIQDAVSDSVAVDENVLIDAAIAYADSIADAISLDEVVVTARVKPIVFKGDTTIVNTNSFKTRDGAYLEELVRLVPGMAYDKESGVLSYNGTPISEININGKAFLKGDKSMALENLRAEIFKQIKIYDKSSDEDMFLGIKRKSGNNFVLDLQTEDEFNGSLMTAAGVGVGNRDRKNAELRSHYFRPGGDSFSLSLRSGNRDMTTLYKKNRRDALSLHLSKDISNKFFVGADLMYGHDRSGSVFSSADESYLPTGDTFSHSTGMNSNKNRRLSANLNMRWTIGRHTRISLTGDIQNARSTIISEGRRASFDADPQLPTVDPFAGNAYGQIPDSIKVNDISQSSTGVNDNKNYSLNATLTRKLNKHGTAIVISGGLNNGDRTGRSFSESDTRYFKLRGHSGLDSVLYRHQYNITPSESRSRTVGLRFTQPLSAEMRFELSYRFKRTREDYTRNTYDLSPFFDPEAALSPATLPPGYESAYVDSLSNYSFSRIYAHEVQAVFMYNSERWNADATFTAEPERRTLDQKTGIMQADTVRSSVSLIPRLSVQYMDKDWSFGMTYDGSTSQPDISSLLSLTDNSNPLYITRGNPRLKAAYRQSLSFDGRNSPLGLSVNIRLSNTINEQTLAVYYNPQTGGRISSPVNINGNRDANLYVSYFKFLKSKFLISGSFSGALRRSVGLINEDMDEQPKRSVTRYRNTGGSGTFQYMYGIFNIRTNVSWLYSHSVNQLQGISEHQSEYAFGLAPDINLPFGLCVSTDASYSLRTGKNISTRDFNQLQWNAEVSWRFLKKRTATVSVRWVDILNDRNNLVRHSSSTGITEYYDMQVGSYFLVSFEYRFNKEFMGKKEEAQRAQERQF